MRSFIQKQQTATKAKSFQTGSNFHKVEILKDSNMTAEQQKRWENYLLKRKKYEEKKKQEANERHYELIEENQKRQEKISLVEQQRYKLKKDQMIKVRQLQQKL